jgi:hypothetical protein
MSYIRQLTALLSIAFVGARLDGKRVGKRHSLYDRADPWHATEPRRHRDLATNSTKPVTTGNPPPQTHVTTATVHVDAGEISGGTTSGGGTSSGGTGGGGGTSSTSSSSSSSSGTSGGSSGGTSTSSSSSGGSGSSGSSSVAGERNPSGPAASRATRNILGLFVAAVVLGVGLASLTFRKV